MANSSLSTSSWTFKQLCWPKLHGNIKPHNVELLQFRGKVNVESGIYEAKLEEYKLGRINNKDIPISCIPPPKYIIGFRGINIL